MPTIQATASIFIPGAGHSSALEQPEAVISAMRELLQHSESRQGVPL